MRKDVLAGVAAAGAALIGGAAFYYLRERQTEEPDYRPLESDGDYQIRDYPAMTVAETVVEGPRRNALDEGFRILADYIFAKSRDGEKLEMTVPVMQDPGDPMASDPPLRHAGRAQQGRPARAAGRGRAGRACSAQGGGGQLFRGRERPAAGRAGTPAARLAGSARGDDLG